MHKCRACFPSIAAFRVRQKLAVGMRVLPRTKQLLYAASNAPLHLSLDETTRVLGVVGACAPPNKKQILHFVPSPCLNIEICAELETRACFQKPAEEKSEKGSQEARVYIGFRV